MQILTVRIMLDLETLGTRAGCGVISIGAKRFDSDAEFHQVISQESNLWAGLEENLETVQWHHKQEYENAPGTYTASSYRANGSSVRNLGTALFLFGMWLGEQGADPNGKTTEVWGNGADFDLPILGHAYQACGMQIPWQPYMGRCYRTLKNMRPEIALERTGKHHNALDDAKSQAGHAVRLLNALGVPV